jgi:hypothetical protein
MAVLMTDVATVLSPDGGGGAGSGGKKRKRTGGGADGGGEGGGGGGGGAADMRRGLTAEQVAGMSVAELREELGSRGLDTAGLKAVLRSRLELACGLAVEFVFG